MGKEKYYIAVIGDIKDSRKAPDRRTLQERLEKTLREANSLSSFPGAERFRKNPPEFYKGFLPDLPSGKKPKIAGRNETSIASDFMITLGDEFQGLLSSGAHLMHIIDYMERNMFPTRLRFGIGIGAIHTPVDRHSPFGMDGPAYNLARDMITVLKDSERMRGEPSANMRIGVEGDDRLVLLVNTIFSLMAPIKEDWTMKQVQVMNVFMGKGQMKQQTTAEAVGITQPSVQKALAASHFYTYHYALHTISTALADIQEFS